MKLAPWVRPLLAALLTAMAGCSLSDVRGFLWISPEAEAAADYYVAKRVDDIAFRAELALQRIGLTTKSTPQGDGFVIDSATRKGNKFRIFVTTDGERTRLRVQWLDSPDRDLQALLIAGLDVALTPAQKK